MPAPRAPSTPAPWASSTISRAPWRSHSSQMSLSGAMSPSIEKTPSTTTSTPPPSPSRAPEHLLELLQPVVAEGAQLRAREQTAVEDRGVVAGVGDHGVADAEDRAERAEVGLMPGREHERVLAAHPLGDLRLQFEVQRRRAVQRARAGEAGAVAVQRILRARDYALVAGEAEVVVGAQHDPLRALHLHHRHRRGAEHVEVGEDVRLARCCEHLSALVVAGLGEHVAGRLVMLPPASLVAGWSSPVVGSGEATGSRRRSLAGGADGHYRRGALGVGCRGCERRSQPGVGRERPEAVHRPAVPPAC